MFTLSNNWITEGTIDFEYKKYMLLAYLRDIDACFKDEKLYPPFADLIQHHRNLLHLRNQLNLMEEKFPKAIADVDLQRMQLLFEKYQKIKWWKKLAASLIMHCPKWNKK